MLCKVVSHTFRGGLHGIVPRPPVGGADLTMRFMELQGIDDPKGFINISSQRQIVN